MSTRLRYGLSDSLVIAVRGLKRIQRQPDLATAFTLQPIMFVLLFVYVFGGAINVPPGFPNYATFMLPGIIVQWMAFGGFATALGLAEDMNRGLIDRFRSLPMARSAVLTGRTLSDIVTNSLGLTVMFVVGIVVGFEFGAPVLDVVAWVGLIVSSPESANAYGFILIFPLTFLSSAFVPPQTFPEPLKTFAIDINPFSKMVDAARALFVGTPAGNNVWISILWCLGLIALFGTLAVARYRRAVAS
jgi:ABC-type polysaccharide/polyol phosphate export permease